MNTALNQRSQESVKNKRNSINSNNLKKNLISRIRVSFNSYELIQSKNTERKSKKPYLNGVRECEGDDVSRLDAGGDELSGGAVDELIDACMGEIELTADGDGAAGGEFAGDVLEQGGESGDSHRKTSRREK